MARNKLGVFLALFVASAALADGLPGLQVINKGVAFPEGPVFRDKTLYYVGYGGTGVISWDGSVNKVVFTEPKCGPTSVTTFGADLLIACYDGNDLVRIRTDGSVVARTGRDSSGNVVLAPNDFTADGKGGLYLTGSGPEDTAVVGGKVYHVSERMVVTEVARDIHFANGLALTPDGKRLLVAEPEAQRILSFAVDGDGALSDRRVFARLDKIDPEGGPYAYADGIRFGPDGNLWVGEYSKGRVAVLSGDGKKFVRGFNVPGEQACPNIAFTPDRKSVVAACVDDKETAPWPGKIYQWNIAP